MNEKKEFVSRRRFVRDASFAGATMFAVPNVSTSREKAKVLTVGEGEFLYEVEHDWGHLPEGHVYGNASHGVTVDKAGLIYVTHYGKPGSIFASMVAPAKEVSRTKRRRLTNSFFSFILEKRTLLFALSR